MQTAMTPLQVEVAIIGAGTAGMGAYRAARAQVDSVLLIEGGAYGTTCARVGCMPSKLLIAAAEAAHQARHTQAFGVEVQAVTVDGYAVMGRVQRERDRFVSFVLETIDAIAPGDRLTAKVKFQDANTLMTEDGQLIHARRIVIALAAPLCFLRYGKGLARVWCPMKT
jgi:dihydrolipoamide dehydrogenase